MKKNHQYLYVLAALSLGCLAGWLVTGAPPGGTPGLEGEGVARSLAVDALGLELEKEQPAGLQALVEAVGEDAGAGARSSGAILLEDAYRLSADSEVRAAVLAALERLGSPQACAALAKIFRLGNEDAAQAATRLSRIEGQDCARELKAIVEKEERRGELARAALRALGKTRSRAATELCQELCAGTYEGALRREAAEALGRIAELSSVPVLAGLLGVEDDKLRKASIAALGLIRSDASAEALRAHGAKGGLGPVEARLVEEALERQQGRGPSRLR